MVAGGWQRLTPPCAWGQGAVGGGLQIHGQGIAGRLPEKSSPRGAGHSHMRGPRDSHTGTHAASVLWEKALFRRVFGA